MMLSAFGNCVRIPELRKKIIFTLGILALCRLAAAVPCPGVDPSALKNLFAQMQHNSGTRGVLQMFNLFTGGALSKFAVGALGIMPYISASIVVSLLTPVFPALEKLQREGETGRQKLTQGTRYLTLIICLIQGTVLAQAMLNPSRLVRTRVADVVTNPGVGFVVMTVIILTCGTMLLMWMGEQVTEHGVGNGASLIITIGILGRLPAAVYSLWTLAMNQGSGAQQFSWIHVIILVGIFVLVTAATVVLTVGVRKVPIQYARTVAGRGGLSGRASFFPLRVNYANVMPIIFASAILMIPPIVLRFFPDWGDVARFFQYGSTSYMFIYGMMVILFSFFWVANQFNPLRIADDLKRQGAYVPGIRPGKPTADYLDQTMTRVTIAGSLFLTALALLPMIITKQLNIPFLIAGFFGGTSLLIIVGVLLDLMRQIESHLLMHHYDGFMKTGHLKSRRR